VVDSASPDRDQQINAVGSVLNEIGALDVPQITGLEQGRSDGRQPRNRA
jgi:50S ribosomal subunit-associated GTPase HflX